MILRISIMVNVVLLIVYFIREKHIAELLKETSFWRRRFFRLERILKDARIEYQGITDKFHSDRGEDR